MIHADVATTLDKSQQTTRLLEASMLNAHGYYTVAPWTYIALMKLHNLEHEKSGQYRGIATQVAPEAAMFARVTLSDLVTTDLPIPRVCATEDGDVALIWTIGLKQIEAIFGADRLGSFVSSDGDTIVGDGEIAAHEVESLATALAEMMAE